MNRSLLYIDGNFYFELSNYYKFHHAKQKRLSFFGLKEMLEEVGNTTIIESNYYKNKIQGQQLDNSFDDILLRDGVNVKYIYSQKDDNSGYLRNNNLDTIMILDIFERAVQYKVEQIIIMATNTSYSFLLPKLHLCGVWSFVLGADINYTQNENEKAVRTSSALLDKARSSLMLNEFVDLDVGVEKLFT